MTCNVAGCPASPGIAIGRICVYHRKEYAPEGGRIMDADGQIERFRLAREDAKRQLEELCGRSSAKAGGSVAAIFNVHCMMLDDPEYSGVVEKMIRSRSVSAERAVSETGARLSERFEAMDDEGMKTKASDVRDITNRLIAVLRGADIQGPANPGGDWPVILAADDLTPSEAAGLDASRVSAIAVRRGSARSHAAILCRAMNIPMLSGADFSEDVDGSFGIVDGSKGVLYVEPDDETVAYYLKRMGSERERTMLLQEVKDLPDVTRDGKKVRLYANIGGVSDLPEAIENNAAGIGLFRTEYLFLESDTYPSQEEQFSAYRFAAEAMDGKKVIIRTIDIGADKQAPYFNLEHEENPAMGRRAIRLCLERQDVFKTQLKAILRAARYGSVGLMFPMIISMSEVRRIKSIIAIVRQELDRDHVPYGNVELGVMVETPAAVWISEELSRDVDFLSIGTNDLSQFILAADRSNPRLDGYADPHHPALLRAIEMTVENAHKGGAWAGICGELAADTTLTETFLRMGVDELSVAPSRILEVRAAIRACRITERG